MIKTKIDEIIDYKNRLEQALAERNHEQATPLAAHIFALAIQEYDDFTCNGILSDNRIIKEISYLRELLAAHESEQEKVWARTIIDGKATLSDFPDRPQYAALLGAEMKKLGDHKRFKNAAFLGCGALPLTAMALSERAELENVFAYDWDREALDLAQKFSEIQNISKTSYHLKNAQDIDFSLFDLIFVASLVTNKEDVLKQISQTAPEGAIVIARTAEKMRSLIYEPVNITILPKTLKTLAYTGIIPQSSNSTYFFQVCRVIEKY